MPAFFWYGGAGEAQLQQAAAGDCALDKTLAQLTTTAASVTVDIDATLARTLAALAVDGDAALGIDASLTKSLAALALSGTIGVETLATLNRTLGGVTLDADGEAAGGVLDGDCALAGVLGALVCAGVLFKWDRQSGEAGTWAAQPGSSGTWSNQPGASGAWQPQAGSSNPWTPQDATQASWNEQKP